MRHFLIVLKSNTAIRQIVMECTNPAMSEDEILRLFLKYEDIHWDEGEKLKEAEIRLL